MELIRTPLQGLELPQVQLQIGGKHMEANYRRTGSGGGSIMTSSSSTLRLRSSTAIAHGLLVIGVVDADLDEAVARSNALYSTRWYL